MPVPVSAPGTGPGVRLHQPGCWVISGGTGATLATREARRMIARNPIATACDVCDAEKTLTAPTTAAHGVPKSAGNGRVGE